MVRHGEILVRENVENWIQSEEFQFLTFGKSEELAEKYENKVFEERVKEGFTNFAITLSQTFLLLIDGFFVNPHYL